VVLLFTIVIGGAGIPERRVGGNSNPQLFMKLDPGTLLQVRMKFHLVHVGLYPVDVMILFSRVRSYRFRHGALLILGG
jgi:hypothetical protein